jgi:hypothetical protein
MLLFDKLKQAKKNLNLEDAEDVCSDPTEYGLTGSTEEPKDIVCPVDIDSEDPSIFESEPEEASTITLDKKEIENILKPLINASSKLPVIDLTDPEKDNATTTVAPIFSKPTYTALPEPSTTTTTTEDISGKTESHITHFLEKYVEGDDTIQVLRYDLMKILSDMHWIKESGNENEQFALDFADALNEISVTI